MDTVTWRHTNRLVAPQKEVLGPQETGSEERNSRGAGGASCNSWGAPDDTVWDKSRRRK